MGDVTYKKYIKYKYKSFINNQKGKPFINQNDVNTPPAVSETDFRFNKSKVTRIKYKSVKVTDLTVKIDNFLYMFYALRSKRKKRVEHSVAEHQANKTKPECTRLNALLLIICSFIFCTVSTSCSRTPICSQLPVDKGKTWPASPAS